jgi:hypothetical protein
MMYVEGAAQGINAASATKAAVSLWAKNGLAFGTLTPFAVMASAAAIGSGTAMGQQLLWAKDMTDEIHARRELQDFGEETTEIYDEEIDNYTGNIETVEDLELEVPEDLTAPQDTATSTTTKQPANTQANNTQNLNNGNDDNNKKKEDDKSIF